MQKVLLLLYNISCNSHLLQTILHVAQSAGFYINTHPINANLLYINQAAELGF